MEPKKMTVKDLWAASVKREKEVMNEIKALKDEIRALTERVDEHDDVLNAETSVLLRGDHEVLTQIVGMFGEALTVIAGLVNPQTPQEMRALIENDCREALPTMANALNEAAVLLQRIDVVDPGQESEEGDDDATEG